MHLIKCSQTSWWFVSPTNPSLWLHRYPAGFALGTALDHQRSWTMCRVQQLFPSASHLASPSHRQTPTGSHAIQLYFKPLVISPRRGLCWMFHFFVLKPSYVPFSPRALSYEAENGVSPGHTPLGSQSPGLTLHTSFPQGQRRESFLYRSDSDYDMSPKTVSRNSSLTSEGWDSASETQKEWLRRGRVRLCFSEEISASCPNFTPLSPVSLRHTGEDFIVTPFAQVSFAS